MVIGENVFLLILFIIFGLSAVIQLFYYLLYYLAPSVVDQPGKSNTKEGVSVIICARNEEVNLKSFLPSILEQDYPDFEVIVVNDCSEDDSYVVLGEYMKKYPNLKISNINKDPQFTHNKKFAQFIGIKAAKNELLLFTDADCRAESPKWLDDMVSHFDSNTDFVLGYGGYLAKKGLLNKYIRYDSMFIAMQYIGMAIRGIPYMGVGRNLAYRRSLFFSSKGFSTHYHLVSGDDDLFVNAYSSRKNTACEIRKEAHTRSVPAESMEQLFRQKKRHLSTAIHYKFRDKFLLITEPVSRVLFYILLIVLLAFLYLWPFVLGVFGIRLAVQIIVFSKSQKRFNEPRLSPYNLIFDIISPCINFVFYISNFRQNSGKNLWK